MSVEEAATRVSNWEVDRSLITEDLLDLRDRNVVSRFPWRGQFSPGLVRLLLEYYGRRGSIVCDPFMGSGTTLFEAIEYEMGAIGIEVNLAGFLLSSLVRFSAHEAVAREQYLSEAACLTERAFPHWAVGLFEREQAPTSQEVCSVLAEVSSDLTKTVISAALLLAMRNGASLKALQLRKALDVVAEVVRRLPLVRSNVRTHLADARTIPEQSVSVDLILTSPPYINVFNYHQHYRPAVELLGWDVLGAARSEIGSNRKNRGNRFLTVIQYCLDMGLACVEAGRVLKPGGTMVVVIGRESSVLGTAFSNTELLGTLALLAGTFTPLRRHERKFITRFGERIFEDVLALGRSDRAPAADLEVFRRVGTRALEHAQQVVPSRAQADLAAAIESAPDVEPSPTYARLIAGLSDEMAPLPDRATH